MFSETSLPDTIREIAKMSPLSAENREVLYVIADRVEGLQANIRILNRLLAHDSTSDADMATIMEMRNRIRHLENQAVTQAQLENQLTEMLSRFGVKTLG